MKKHFVLFLLCFAFIGPALSQKLSQPEGILTKNMLSAIRELSSQLSGSCQHTMFIIEFRLNEQGSQVDSVHIVSTDKRFASLIDTKKLKQLPAIWPALLNRHSFAKGTIAVLPVLIMSEGDRCSQPSVPSQEILDSFTYLQSYNQRLNNTAFLLNIMDIKVSSVSCGPARLNPIAGNASPATTSADDAN